jgi:uncharacterized membrane protein
MTFVNVGRFTLKTASGFLMALLLLGCSLYPDVNTDPAKNNKATFRQDALDYAQAYPETGSGAHIKQRIGCMNLKGWH